MKKDASTRAVPDGFSHGLTGGVEPGKTMSLRNAPSVAQTHQSLSGFNSIPNMIQLAGRGYAQLRGLSNDHESELNCCGPGDNAPPMRWPTEVTASPMTEMTPWVTVTT